MKNKKTYYTVSALLWLLVGLISYQLYLLQNNKNKTEKHLIVSANEIHKLHNLGFNELEIWRKRDKRGMIMMEYDNPRGRVILDSISIVEDIVDSLEMKGKINFANVESLYYVDYSGGNEYISMLKPITENEHFYNKSNLYKLLYKNTLLTTLRDDNNEKYHKIGCFCHFFRLPKLYLFEKNKIGLQLDRGYFDIFYCNYPKTNSTNFEFETVVEKLGRNPQTIRTRYKTTPKGDFLGKYDYEEIETIVEK
ncbi:hypothetical protein ACE193_16105 [Bernardetia sp. OM2101]|uniref:hypothetical protein n=1 Tax=Bernardetia sp. OM2101 TaxID=3344876 RepID=UPI0035D0AE03